MVRDQIQAAADVGISSWVLWNPRSDYDPRIFRPAKPQARTVALGAASRPEPGGPPVR
jgi:hypothetical protein